MTDDKPIAVVVGGGDAPAEDVAAMLQIQEYRQQELPRLQGRAEKWIGGLTALTGVLTAAIVVKGPETFTKLAPTRKVLRWTVQPQDAIVASMLFGGLALALGVWWMYGAAHGDPLSRNGLDELVRNPPERVTGAAASWQSAVATTAADARRRIRRGSVSTIVGVLLLAVAVLITWTTPEKSDTDTPKKVCIAGADGKVVVLKSGLPDVVSGEIRVVPCP